jgi:multidrug efflux pump subunit AcrB
MAGALLFLIGGGVFMSQLKTQFFPKDLSYLSYVDVWLPADAPLSATNEAAAQSEEIIREVIQEYGQHHKDSDGKPREMLKSLTTFVGGGGPRFWFSLSPELQRRLSCLRQYRSAWLARWLRCGLWANRLVSWRSLG